MTIEIKKRASKEFAEDTVNAAGQYKQFMKKPERRLQDNFKQWKAILIASIVWIVLILAIMVMWGSDAIKEICFVILVVNIVVSAAMLFSMTKYRNAIIDEQRISILTIDESGVEITKEGVQTVKVTWENVAFIRLFRSALCFFPKNLTSFVISVDMDYSEQIIHEIKEIGVDVKII